MGGDYGLVKDKKHNDSRFFLLANGLIAYFLLEDDVGILNSHETELKTQINEVLADSGVDMGDWFDYIDNVYKCDINKIDAHWIRIELSDYVKAARENENLVNIGTYIWQLADDNAIDVSYRLCGKANMALANRIVDDSNT